CNLGGATAQDGRGAGMRSGAFGKDDDRLARRLGAPASLNGFQRPGGVADVAPRPHEGEKQRMAAELVLHDAVRLGQPREQDDAVDEARMIGNDETAGRMREIVFTLDADIAERERLYEYEQDAKAEACQTPHA